MKPILCFYYITYRCNMKCSYCDIWKKGQRPNARDSQLREVADNLPQLRSLGIRFIDFTGGEPLLHPDLPAMLALAKKLGFRTTVTTNCLLYPQKAESLKGLVDFLHFSLDSLDEADNNRLRGKNSFVSVMKSIEIAKELGERPDILFTATIFNFKAIDNLSRFVAEQKLMLIVNPVFRYGSQEILNDAMLDYLEKFKRKPYVYVNKAFHRLIRNGGNDTTNPRCRAISSTIVISPANEVILPCYHFAQLSIPIRGNLKQIRESKMVTLLKKQQGSFPFCQGCTVNCYFDPSFLYKLDSYFWLSLISKVKYGVDKYVRFK
ncbi:MAG: radical SAM protein [Candidatus Zhuqueibacterota bacterium]